MSLPPTHPSPIFPAVLFLQVRCIFCLSSFQIATYLKYEKKDFCLSKAFFSNYFKSLNSLSISSRPFARCFLKTCLGCPPPLCKPLRGSNFLCTFCDAVQFIRIFCIFPHCGKSNRYSLPVIFCRHCRYPWRPTMGTFGVWDGANSSSNFVILKSVLCLTTVLGIVNKRSRIRL